MSCLRVCIALAAVMILSPVAVATEPVTHDNPQKAELQSLLSSIVGRFDNRQQVERGENFLRDGPVDPQRAPDLLFPVFALVEAPSIGKHVVYLQWHMGSPDGPLQRQRIWSFEIDSTRNAVMMDFFTLREPERWRDAHLRPEVALRSLTTADLLPYPPACRLPFRRHIDVFIVEIPSGECRIVSQQTRTAMTINARIVVGQDALWYDESGIRADGSVVFQVPASGSYQFRRQRRVSRRRGNGQQQRRCPQA